WRRDPALAWAVAHVVERRLAAAVDAVSAAAWPHAAPTTSPDLRLFRRGFAELPTVTSNDCDLRTGTTVVAIERSSTGVVVATDAATGPRRLAVDAVIVTVPVSVLQAGSPRFLPALPGATRTALAGFSPGHLETVALRFPSRFWDPGPVGRVSPDPHSFTDWLDLTDVAGAPVIVATLVGAAAAASTRRAETAVAADATRALLAMYP
ncbi:MAG: amine oxidase, partial [Acidimicrobiales bacterium]|nr:amine oxidase [Acidimicrobiales bacterium]